MRLVGLCLTGLVSYLLAVLFFFPASPVIDRVRPLLGPVVALEGVDGRLFKGVISRVASTDDLLPLEFQNVGWTLSLPSLLMAKPGAKITFDGYGGTGQALVQRSLGGDIIVNDFRANLQAKELEPLLPVPVASFSGNIVADIDQIKLVNQLLTRFEGELRWQDAMLESPVPASLGEITITISPNGEQAHLVTLGAQGGEVLVDGQINITLAGDYNSEINITPTANASPALVNSLRQIGRPDRDGRVRIREQGNVNRLL